MDNPQNPDNSPEWERRTLEKLAFAALNEQKAGRRWGVFFKALTFIYLSVVLLAVVDWGADSEHHERHTAMVSLNGVIQSKGEANAEKLMAALQSAFEEKNSVGVVLRINSPGGSPVQAGMINDEIHRLRAKYPEKPLYAVVEDMCASGGYYVAVAADKIYVNKSSIVGSIGVLMDGFGFTGTMDKAGVERRLLTAGENKGFLDPFSPQAPQHKAHAQLLLDDIHRQFIDVVKAGRGKRLKETEDTFSGLFWSGQQAIELGLADQLGNLDFVAREIVKAEDIIDYTRHENVAERLAKRFGAAFGDSSVRALKSLSVLR